MKFIVDGILRRVEGKEENVIIPDGVRKIYDEFSCDELESSSSADDLFF